MGESLIEEIAEVVDSGLIGLYLKIAPHGRGAPREAGDSDI